MEAEPSKAEPPKRKRRWFQFSLRSLLILVLVAGLGMAWLAALKRRADRQQTAAETIVNAGGSVFYDYQFQVSPSGAINYSDKATPPGPKWLRRQLGNDFFTNVDAARITTQAGIDALADLPQIQNLEVDGAAVTDESLDQVVRLRHLRALSLLNTSISDSGLRKIAVLDQLRTLELLNNRITDEGLLSLAGLERLEYLELKSTKISDDGLKHLRRMSHLRELRLSFNRITGVGLRELADLPSLERLYLDETQVDDASAAILSRLSHLQTLDLDGTRLTDAGLQSLARLKNLRWIAVNRVHGVTEEGIAELERALPELNFDGRGRNNPEKRVPLISVSQ
jgi:Leucine Rich Repeat (LRR) protein